jgi:hypothetical protein
MEQFGWGFALRKGFIHTGHTQKNADIYPFPERESSSGYLCLYGRSVYLLWASHPL